MRADYFTHVKTFCTMCGVEVSPDRGKKAITCSDACRDLRKNWKRSRQDARECRYCHKPSTPEERKRYQRWFKYEEKNPPPDSELAPHERQYRAEHPPQKRGRKPLKKATIEPEENDGSI